MRPETRVEQDVNILASGTLYTGLGLLAIAGSMEIVDNVLLTGDSLPSKVAGVAGFGLAFVGAVIRGMSR